MEVSTETPDDTFRQIYLVDGKYIYSLMAGPPKPDNMTAMDRFFASLKIPKR